MPKNPAPSAFSVNLGVVNASQIVKGYLTVGIKDQDWQQQVLIKVLYQQVVTLTILLGVECHNCESCSPIFCVHKLVYLEIM